MTENNRREELLQRGVVIEVDGRCKSLSYVSSMGIYSSANVYFHQCSGRVDRGGDGDSEAEGGGDRAEEGRYPYNAEATDSIFACCRM